MSASGENLFTFEQAEHEFRRAWNHAGHTRFEPPPVDVNRVLRERYTVEPATAMTLTQLWDMEIKKAWDPVTYIPYMVLRGRSWGRHTRADGSARFYRTSDQVAWIGDSRGRVIEDVSVSPQQRRIIFLGRPHIIDDSGETVRASGFQPLFHVEHAAAGAEERPLNVWRIVMMTEHGMTQHEDHLFKRRFADAVADGYLPGFIEEYLRRDMGVQLVRAR